MQSENKRIAVNTIALYLRSIFTMAIGIFTSRVFLQTLGMENVGIYNVVGGLVSMFSVISTTMSVACSRFLAIALGAGNMDELKRHFSIAMSIHVMFALIVIGIAELIGIWYLNTYMNIAPERLYAANWVFQLSLLTFGINMISSPYNMIINLHEHMKTFAYMSIFDVSMKLLILYILLIINYDRLIIYAILILCVSIINRMIYSIYCYRHFEETHNFKIILRFSTMKEQFGFAGWNSIGIFSGFLRNYGTDLLLNFFFGVTVNAARGIANQIQNAVYGFVTNFQSAIAPQISKSYGAGNLDRIKNLVEEGSKFSFFLLSLFALPIIIEADNLLKIWLIVVPNYTTIFLRLTFISLLVESISRLIIIALTAEGSVKIQQSVIGPITLLTIPFMGFCFYYLQEPIWAYICIIIVDIIAWSVRLFFWKKMLHFNPYGMLFNVLLRCFSALIIAGILPWYVSSFFSGGWTELIIVTLTSLCSAIIVYSTLGLNKKEREFIFEKIVILKNKLINSK